MYKEEGKLNNTRRMRGALLAVGKCGQRCIHLLYRGDLGIQFYLSGLRRPLTSLFFLRKKLMWHKIIFGYNVEQKRSEFHEAFQCLRIIIMLYNSGYYSLFTHWHLYLLALVTMFLHTHARQF